MQFVSFLGQFRVANPEIEITLLDGMSDQLCQLLAKGELDVALMTCERLSGASAGFETLLGVIRYRLLCGPSVCRWRPVVSLSAERMSAWSQSQAVAGRHRLRTFVKAVRCHPWPSASAARNRRETNQEIHRRRLVQ